MNDTQIRAQQFNAEREREAVEARTKRIFTQLHKTNVEDVPQQTGMRCVVQSYPATAGYTNDDTSRDAATAIESSGRAKVLRERVLWTFRQTVCGIRLSFTADEIADNMNESILSIRPRVSELHKQGLIEPTGERRRSSGGRPSHVWRLK